MGARSRAAPRNGGSSTRHGAAVTLDSHGAGDWRWPRALGNESSGPSPACSAAPPARACSVVLAALSLFVADCLSLLRRRNVFGPDTTPDNTAATVVIPNWNGRDLLEKYIPSIVEALAGNDANEILVVDNASQDGSVEFLREHFPQVTVVALEGNRGFGGGSNAGFRAARNDVVVLLNSDMRVAPDFLLRCWRRSVTQSVRCHVPDLLFRSR